MSFSLQDLKPVWSSQHGATVTLGVCWGIPVLIGGSFYAEQIVTLVFLFSGFMFMELFGDGTIRGRWKDQRKALWSAIYLALLLLSGMYQFFTNSLFLFVVPFLLVGGALHFMLTLQKKDRELHSQLLAFSLFALAGLLSFPPDFPIGLSDILRLWIVEALYFGISPVAMKLRRGGLSKGSVLAYLIVSLLLLFFFSPSEPLLYVLGIFFTGKTLFPVLATEKFMALKIKQIGLLELMCALLFLALVPVFY